MARPKYKITTEADFFAARQYLSRNLDTWNFWAGREPKQQKSALSAYFNRHNRQKLPETSREQSEEKKQGVYQLTNEFIEKYLDEGQRAKIHNAIRQKRKTHRDEKEGDGKNVKVTIGRQAYWKLQTISEKKGHTMKQSLENMIAISEREVRERDVHLRSTENELLKYHTDDAVFAQNSQLKRVLTGLNKLLNDQDHRALLTDEGKSLIERSANVIDDLIRDRVKIVKDRR